MLGDAILGRDEFREGGPLFRGNLLPLLHASLHFHSAQFYERYLECSQSEEVDTCIYMLVDSNCSLPTPRVPHPRFWRLLNSTGSGLSQPRRTM